MNELKQMRVLLAVIVEPPPGCDPPCPVGYNCSSVGGQYTCTGQPFSTAVTCTVVHCWTWMSSRWSGAEMQL